MENTEEVNQIASTAIKRSKIPPKMREIILNMHNIGNSVKKIAESLQLNRSSIYNVIKIFKEENRIDVKRRGGDRRSKISEVQKQKIVEWVNADPTVTLKKLVQKFNENFQIVVDDNTIDRIFKNFHFSLKQLVILQVNRNINATIESRFNYSQQFFNYLYEQPDNNFVFIDEAGFSVSSRTKKGRSLVGVSPVITVPSIKSRNISIIASATKYGMLDFHVNVNPVTGENFKTYLENLKNICHNKNILNPIFILDNARIHHYSGIADLVNLLNLNILYLPPYSPMCNIIENCFSKWKNFVVRSNPENEGQLFRYINEGFNQISSDDCEGFFRKMLRSLEKCRNREIFNE
jgi:transposase